jgi:hypothetical protein
LVQPVEVAVWAGDKTVEAGAMKTEAVEVMGVPISEGVLARPI